MAFLARIRAALTRTLQSASEKEHIFVVTSCMPIIAAVKTILGVEESGCRDLESVLANASFSTLLYQDDNLKLLGFNSYSYLEGGGSLVALH